MHSPSGYYAWMAKQRLADVLAKNVEGLRKARRLSQKTVAKNGSIDQGTVSRVERKIYPCTLDTIEALATGIGVEAWLLLVPDLDPSTPPVLAVGSAEVSKAEREQVETVTQQVDNWTPAQRHLFISSEKMQSLIVGPAYPEEAMDKKKWVEPRGNDPSAQHEQQRRKK